jgi:hypothetical protein
MRFGVPDDDMPDSLPPPGWGPAPFDERDLDALLAGEMTDVALALRPVADALATLCAGPAPAELRGEANVMAEFRALGLGRGHAAHPAGLAQTLLLEALPADTARPRSARRRGRRRAPRPAGRRAGALTAVAAVAALVVAVVFSGDLPGPIGRLAHMAHLPATPSSTQSAGHSAAPKLEAPSAAVEPTSHPAVTHPAAPAQTGASSDCRTYYGYYTHPVSLSHWSAEMSLWQQLTKLAGSQNPHQVYLYCARHVSDLFPQWNPEMGQYPPAAHPSTGNTGTGNTGAGNQDSGHPGQQNDGAGGTQNGSGYDPGAGFAR